MSYPDRTLTCSECGARFVFTSGEQEFHASKGFTNDPGRCPECRAARKAQRDRSGHGSYGDSRPMFAVTCASCGNEARVPFQPRGDKPVYCSGCFRAQGGGRLEGAAGRTAR